MEPRHEPAVASAFPVLEQHGLLERYGVAPVPESDPRVRPCVHGLAENDEPLEPRPRKRSLGRTGPRERRRFERDERNLDLAAEEPHVAHRRRRIGTCVGSRAGARGRGGRTGGERTAVAGICDRADRAGAVRRRGGVGRSRRVRTWHGNLDAESRGRGPRRRAGRRRGSDDGCAKGSKQGGRAKSHARRVAGTSE